MKRNSQTLAGCVAAAAVLLGIAATPASAGPPTIVSVSVTAQQSSGGVTPTTNGSNYFYDYAINAGLEVEDSIPVGLCAAVTQAGDGAGFPLDIEFGNGAGGNLPGVTKPATVTFLQAGCQTVYIGVDTGALAAGDYSSLVPVQSGGAPSKTNVNVDYQNIHIRVSVTAGETTRCFFTDSSFQFLLDCAGNVVTSGNGGRFSIVTNRKNIQVATNPGQFYYNILWTNTTGQDRTVNVDFVKTGVRPQGAQAIHAKLFPSFPSVDAAAFAEVNEAIPGGADDSIENIVVPAGWTLWVDYHLEWATLGALLDQNAALSCSAANQEISLTGRVSDAETADTLGSCSAGAIGYKK